MCVELRGTEGSAELSQLYSEEGAKQGGDWLQRFFSSGAGGSTTLKLSRVEKEGLGIGGFRQDHVSTLPVCADHLLGSGFPS